LQRGLDLVNKMSESEEESDSVDGDPETCTIKQFGWCPKIFGALIDDHDTHDVTFKTSDGGSVSAHRAMVAAGSPVLRAMLYGGMKESSENVIELENVSSEILQYLFTFIYKGKVSFNMNSCLDLLDTAHYFGIDTLESLCVDRIYLTAINFGDIATFAHRKGYQNLLQKCLSYMCTHAAFLIKSSQFKDLPTEVLFAFFENSNVRAKEVELFTAAVECYRHKGEDNAGSCSSLFELIRYPLISKDDLLDKVRPNQEKNLALYTAALEYHIDVERYSGPPHQIALRKPWFEIISITPDTVVLKRNVNETLISRIGTSGWNGLCAIRVGPQEQPIKFMLSTSDPCHIHYYLTSTNVENLSCETHENNLWGSFGSVYTSAKAYSTTQKGKKVFKFAFGPSVMYAPIKKDTSVFFCIYMRDAGDEIGISHFK